MKKIAAFIFLGVILILSLVSCGHADNGLQAKKEKKNYDDMETYDFSNIVIATKTNTKDVFEAIHDITKNQCGEISLYGEKSNYLGKPRLEYRDDDYIYDIDKETNELLFITPIIYYTDMDKSLFGRISSIEEAEEIAKSIVNSLNFEMFYDYDIFLDEIGEDFGYKDYARYHIHFREKIAEKFYTGNGIGITLTRTGILDDLSYLRFTSIDDIKALNPASYIKEEYAIDIVYDYLNDYVKKYEEECNSEVDDPDKFYRIYIEDKKPHTINAYKQIHHETHVAEWVIEISNIETNYPLWEYKKKYIVNIDAHTGEVLNLNENR